MSELGVKAFYGELADGKLADLAHIRAMGSHIMSIVRKHDITALATMGETGYCGHADHRASHLAARAAQIALRISGRDLPLFELQPDGSGELRVPVRAQRKLSSLALNASQIPLAPDGTVSPLFFQLYPGYMPLLTEETYDIS